MIMRAITVLLISQTNVHFFTNAAKKLKQFAKQSEIKALKEDHIRLKEYVKYEISSFKAMFKDL